jgi:hypothetical protein
MDLISASVHIQTVLQYHADPMSVRYLCFTCLMSSLFFSRRVCILEKENSLSARSLFRRIEILEKENSQISLYV